MRINSISCNQPSFKSKVIIYGKDYKTGRNNTQCIINTDQSFDIEQFTRGKAYRVSNGQGSVIYPNISYEDLLKAIQTVKGTNGMIKFDL